MSQDPEPAGSAILLALPDGLDREASTAAVMQFAVLQLHLLCKKSYIKACQDQQNLMSSYRFPLSNPRHLRCCSNTPPACIYINFSGGELM